MPLLLVTQKMAQEQGLDCHQDQEKQSQDTVELQLELLQEEVEMKSQLWRQEFFSTSSKD